MYHRMSQLLMTSQDFGTPWVINCRGVLGEGWGVVGVRERVKIKIKN
jgi:hypothetical protein